MPTASASLKYSAQDLFAGIAALELRLVSAGGAPPTIDRTAVSEIARAFDAPSVFQSKRFRLICRSICDCFVNSRAFDFVAYVHKHADDLLAIINSDKRISRRQFTAGLMKQCERDLVARLGYKPGKVALLQAALQSPKVSGMDEFICRTLIAKDRLFHALGGKLDIEQLYRLVIDGNDECHGDYFYENEAGYLPATLAAWANCFQQPVVMSRQGYEALYRDITADMRIGAGYRSTPLDHDHFREYATVTMNSDAFGSDDICRLSCQRDAEPMSLYGMDYQLRMVTEMSHVDKAQQLFDIANAALAKKPEPNAAHRLMIYVWLARELELHHLFSDGNGRSTTLLLSSLIHHDPGMPDLMFYNPNLLDLNGPLKLAGHVLDAMQRFADVAGTTTEANAVIDALQKQIDVLVQKHGLCTWSSVMTSFGLDSVFIASSKTAQALMQFNQHDDLWFAVSSAIVADDDVSLRKTLNSSAVLNDPLAVRTLFEHVLEVGGPRCLQVLLKLTEGYLAYPRLYKLAQSFVYPDNALRDAMFERFGDETNLDVDLEWLMRTAKSCAAYTPPVRDLNGATSTDDAATVEGGMAADPVSGGAGAGGGAGAVAAVAAQGLFRNTNALRNSNTAITTDVMLTEGDTRCVIPENDIRRVIP